MESIDSLNSIDSPTHRLTLLTQFIRLTDSQRLTDSNSTHPIYSTHRLTTTHRLTRLHQFIRLTLTTTITYSTHRLTLLTQFIRLTDSRLTSQRLTSLTSTHNDSRELFFHHFIRNYSHLFYLSYFIFIFILF